MSFEAPETRFASVSGRSIAFQVCGGGELDLVFTPGSFNHVDVWWEHPVTAGFLRALASFSRLILFDRRGTGASDPLPSDELPDWRDWVADMTAVLDAAGSERAAIFASLDGGPTALALAAEQPDRVSKLVLYNTTARYRVAEDYACGVSDERLEAVVAGLSEHWGTDAFSAMNYPDRADDTDFLRWYAKYQRASIGRGRVEAIARAWFDIDARELLPKVRAPTLVLQRASYAILPESHGKWLSEQLASASYVSLPGSSAMFARDSATILERVAHFLTGEALSLKLERDATRPATEVRGYQLVRPVGRGGMGEVWEARRESDGERVAIKLLSGPDAPELRQRFAREGQAMAAVLHPAVARIHEVTLASNATPAIVMELLIGETLSERLARQRTLTIEESARLMQWVVSAVGTAHALSFVHRDLKPANVFLTRGTDAVAPVKVLDFGIAKVLRETRDISYLTATGALLGTPAYMAPEQLFGERVDHRADIWALGLTLLETLTGILPTRATSIGQVVKLVLESAAWRLDEHLAAVPAVLSALVIRMLATNPDERPADLREVFEILSGFAATAAPTFGAPLSRDAELDVTVVAPPDSVNSASPAKNRS